MASKAYAAWKAAGQPVELARPVADLVTLAAAASVPILGTIGDLNHLTAAIPGDHTPFPANPWPAKLPRPIVCAIDLQDGPWSKQLLLDATEGIIPWVKYLNYGGRHFDVRNGWRPTSSKDHHLHISIRSDHIATPLGSYNPFSRLETWFDRLMATMETVRRGDRGTKVRRVQALLVAVGAGQANRTGYIDGIFGPGTESDVKQFQIKHGLAADGVVGRLTMTLLLTA